jgi:hypothetical protein
MNDIKVFDAKELVKALPEAFMPDGTPKLKLMSRYGWKIVTISGELCVVPGDETDYRRCFGDLSPQEIATKMANPCYQTYPTNCIGATCCQLWYDANNKYWVCSC